MTSSNSYSIQTTAPAVEDIDVDVDVDMEDMEDGMSFADASTVVVQNIAPKKGKKVLSVSSSGENKESNNSNGHKNPVMSEEEKEMVRSLQERKVTESMRRALIMNQGGSAQAHSTGDEKIRIRSNEISSSASTMDNASVNNYPLSVATGDAVMSHRLASVAENDDEAQGTDESDDENGEEQGTAEVKLKGLLNFPTPVHGKKSKGRSLRNSWLVVAMGLTVVGLIVGILFAAGVLGSGSSSDNSFTEEDYITVFESVSERSLLETPKTPQRKALNWIMNLDTYGLSPVVSGNHDALIQRYAMALFYYSFTGSSWLLSTEWLSGTDVCTWYGLHCSSDGTVSEIVIESNMLEGTFPTDIIDALPFLYSIKLGKNLIQGSINPYIANLSNLTYFIMEDNRLTGPLPFDLFYAEKLQVLNVRDNLLTGQIPSTISFLSNLSELNFAGNTFTGTIPVEIGELGNLVYLFLQTNEFRGILPSSLGLLGSLREVLLFNNNLSGSIPSELGLLSEIEILRLDSNELSGFLPPELGNLTKLSLLKINGNSISGVVPELFCDLNATISADCGDSNLTLCSCCTSCF